ncbi:hypermethylated in cancer 1 protein [Scyliorhinus canicula]|uniref:hypermethylated in cancer 1 protein n=1 Tax=Scyliorhinus canicula TaxID=7830 RepID=UPI0018F2FFED|nr:hypermethylated in cancer 1 protein [Scyliorhinus canicula]
MMPMVDSMEMCGHSKQLLVQLNRQRTKGFLCDVIIVVQNALFRAHKNILAASSVYLKSLVVHDNLVNLDPDMVSPGVFRTILDYIYTGRLSEAELNIGAVLAAASYLQLPDLVSVCKKKLKRSGSYLHFRSGSVGKVGRTVRVCSPLTQPPYPRLLEPPAAHTINTQAGELYAPLSQASRRLPAQELGLDLSKPSPRSCCVQPGEAECGQGSPQASSPGRLLTNGSCLQEGPPSNHRAPEASPPELLSRWLKQEPLGPFGEGQPRAPFPAAACEEAEDEKSSSEESSSEEAGLPAPLDGYHCGHLGYQPEHFGDNLYVCIPCGKGFPNSEGLNAHVESHTEEDLLHKELEQGSPGVAELLRPYRCSSCEKSYKDPATLRQHEKTHWLSRPYPCSICGKKFTQRGTMTRHMRSHLGLKPFACEACGMRFTRQYRLTEHMRIHSGEKPYHCHICGGNFAQQRNLISHMKMHTADCKPKIDFTDNVYPLPNCWASPPHPNCQGSPPPSARREQHTS